MAKVNNQIQDKKEKNDKKEIIEKKEINKKNEKNMMKIISKTSKNTKENQKK